MSYETADGYKIRDQSAIHFLTFTVMGWIDIFNRQCYRDIIIESFQFCRSHKQLRIGAFVIMSNHVHVIWQAGKENLSDVIRDFKTFTSKSILKHIESDAESRKKWLLYMFKFYANRTNANDVYKVWTNGNHPETIHTEDFLMTKLNYIHDNPVRAGIVSQQVAYIYSSAANYQGKAGIMEIDLLF